MDKQTVTLLGIGIAGALLVSWFMWPAGYVMDLSSAPELTLPTGEERKLDSVPTEGMSYQNVQPSELAVDLPFPNATVGSEFTVRGKVSETWLAGKSMTVFVYAVSGEEIGIASVEATGKGVLALRADVVLQTYSGEATVILVRNDTEATPESASLITFPVVVRP